MTKFIDHKTKVFNPITFQDIVSKITITTSQKEPANTLLKSCSGAIVIHELPKEVKDDTIES